MSTKRRLPKKGESLIIIAKDNAKVSEAKQMDIRHISHQEVKQLALDAKQKEALTEPFPRTSSMIGTGISAPD